MAQVKETLDNIGRVAVAIEEVGMLLADAEQLGQSATGSTAICVLAEDIQRIVKEGYPQG